MFTKVQMRKITKRRLGPVKNRKNTTKWQKPTNGKKPIAAINSKQTVKKAIQANK